MPQQVSLQHEIFPTSIISVLLTPAQITKVNNNNRKKIFLNIKNLDFFFFFNSDSLLAFLVDREPDMELCLCNGPRSQMSSRKSVWSVFSVTWLTEESLDLPNEQTETGHADDR